MAELEATGKFKISRMRHFKKDPSMRELALWALQEVERSIQHDKILDVFNFRIHRDVNSYKPFCTDFYIATSVGYVEVSVKKKKWEVFDNLPCEAYLTGEGQQTRGIAKKIREKKILNISNEQLEG